MSLSLEFFGLSTLGVDGRPSDVSVIRTLWSPFASSGPGPADARVAVSDIAEACAEINRHAVATCPFPAAHAGVVEMGGGAIVVPADSGVGKSTLVTALCRLGARYVSDEALVLDGTGAAHGYPKPVALAPESMALLGLDPCLTLGEHGPPGAREHLVPAEALGGWATGMTPVRHIVLPERRTDGVTGTEDLRSVPRREGLATLVRLSFNHYRDPAGFLASAAAAVAGAQVWRLTYSDARHAARLMADVLP